MITANEILKLREDIKKRYLGELLAEGYKVIYDTKYLKVNLSKSTESLHQLIYWKYEDTELKVYSDQPVWLPKLNRIVEMFEKGRGKITKEELEVLCL